MHRVTFTKWPLRTRWMSTESSASAAAKQTVAGQTNGTNLKLQWKSDLKKAMLAKDTRRTAALKSMLSEWTYAEKKSAQASEQGLGYSEAMIVLQRLIRKRQESVDVFQKAGRNDLVQVEQTELSILQSYLPPPLSPELLLAKVREAMAEVGARKPQDVGKVMALLKQRVDASMAAPSVVAQLVQQELKQKS